MTERIRTLSFLPIDFREWPLEMDRLITIGINKSFAGGNSDTIVNQLNQTYPDNPFSLYKKFENRMYVRWLSNYNGNELVFYPPLEFDEYTEEFQIHIRIAHNRPCYFFLGLDQKNLLKTWDRFRFAGNSKLLKTDEEARYHMVNQMVFLKERDRIDIFFGFYSEDKQVTGKICFERKREKISVRLEEIGLNEDLPEAVASAAAEALQWTPNKTICHAKEINDVNCTKIVCGISCTPF